MNKNCACVSMHKTKCTTLQQCQFTVKQICGAGRGEQAEKGEGEREAQPFHPFQFWEPQKPRVTTLSSSSSLLHFLHLLCLTSMLCLHSLIQTQRKAYYMKVSRQTKGRTNCHTSSNTLAKQKKGCFILCIISCCCRTPHFEI